MNRRLIAHHAPLFLVSALTVGVLYATRPYRDALSRASFATAYPALALLAATLVIGPSNVVLQRRNPVSSDLRRDLGIWAGILGLLHVVVGQNVHLRGRPWLYYIYEHPERHGIPIRHDLFGFANFTGAAASLVLIALLATSNDCALRVLGTPRWKSLQQWNYLTFLLVTAHTLAYLVNENQKRPFVVTAAACIAVTFGMQVAGYLRRRS